MQPEFANVLAVNCHNFIIMNNDLYALLIYLSLSYPHQCHDSTDKRFPSYLEQS